MNDLAKSRKRSVIDNNLESKTSCNNLTNTIYGDRPSIKRPRQSIERATEVHETSASTDGEMQLKSNSNKQTGPSVKATKSDDAEDNEQQWDVWSVDSFRPSSEETAKVCIVGTYSPEQHGKLFQGLCRIAM